MNIGEMHLNATVVVALIGAAVSLLSAFWTAATRFSINKATATKISTDSQGVEASTAEVFSRLAAEWTIRADLRVEILERRIGQLCDVVETLAMAVDHVTPLLAVEYADDPRVVALGHAARTARRLAI